MIAPGPLEEVPESAAQVVAYLTSQHRRIAGLLDTVLDTADDPDPVAFNEFRRLLAVHEATEQEIVHPRARHELADGPTVVTARLEEESALHDTLALIAAGQELDKSLLVHALTTLRANLVAHHRHEEVREFAGLRIELGSRQVKRMRTAVRLAAHCHDYPPCGRPPRQSDTFASLLIRAGDTIRATDHDED